MYIWDVLETPIGNLDVLCSEDIVFAIHFKESKVFQRILKKYPFKASENALSMSLKNQLNQYFLGERDQFSIPLQMEGTDFQKKVWECLLKIPFGKTFSYKDLSEMMCMPSASRAIGNANGQNPFLVVVPCHRVILKNGKFGGYSAGIEHKKWLLNFENLKIKNP